MTSIEEDKENCQDPDEIEDLIQPPTKYEAMQALEVLQTCTFYDVDLPQVSLISSHDQWG